MNKKAFEERQKFFQTFSARVNDTIDCAEMAELRASNKTLKAMGLAQNDETQSVWGMIVVCQKSLYFYVPPRDLLFMSMVRAGERTTEEEQLFCFSNLLELRFIATPKKWYNIFSPNKIGFAYIIEGQTISGEFFVGKNADELLLKMRATLSK